MKHRSRRWAAEVVLVLALVASTAALWQPEGSPARVDRDEDYRVYSALLDEMKGWEGEPIPGIIVVVDRTDVTAVPGRERGLARRIQAGYSRAMAENAADREEWKYRRAMGQIGGLASAHVDFEERNLGTLVLENRFRSRFPCRVVSPAGLRRLFEAGNLSAGCVYFSTIGYSEDGTQAVVSFESLMMQQDVLLVRVPGGEWKLARASGGRFVMD